MLATPEAGPPKATANPRLAGLRAWPVKGFDAGPGSTTWCAPGCSMRCVLHSKRDIGAILDRQDVDEL